MNGRFRILGVVLAVFGLAFVAAGGYAFIRTQDGAKSLQAFSAAQNVKLTYDDQGRLTDRGTTDGAASIMSLLENDWGYKVDRGELNPNDPLVNTASEYMYQMATITYHTLHAKVTVTIPKDVEFQGQTIKAGDYDFQNNGKYWTGFDRTNPIEGAARDKVWTATAHALIGELGVGASNASSLQMGLGLAGLFAGLGLVLIVTGLGVIWAVRPARIKAPAFAPVPTPA